MRCGCSWGPRQPQASSCQPSSAACGAAAPGASGRPPQLAPGLIPLHTPQAAPADRGKCASRDIPARRIADTFRHVYFSGSIALQAVELSVAPAPPTAFLCRHHPQLENPLQGPINCLFALFLWLSAPVDAEHQMQWSLTWEGMCSCRAAALSDPERNTILLFVSSVLMKGRTCRRTHSIITVCMHAHDPDHPLCAYTTALPACRTCPEQMALTGLLADSTPGRASPCATLPRR